MSKPRKGTKTLNAVDGLSAALPVLFAALSLVYIWFIQPGENNGLKALILTIVIAISFASNIAHRDRLQDIGLRLDNLWLSAREVGIATILMAVVVIGIGIIAGANSGSRNDLSRSLLLYPVWALVQQYAMQSFTYRRIAAATHHPTAAAAFTAILFASLHAPNLALILVTLIGGFVWCLLFKHNPNLIMLARSHDCLAMLLWAFWPAEWMHNLRIGPGYWTWTP